LTPKNLFLICYCAKLGGSSAMSLQAEMSIDNYVPLWGPLPKGVGDTKHFVEGQI